MGFFIGYNVLDVYSVEVAWRHEGVHLKMGGYSPSAHYAYLTFRTDRFTLFKSWTTYLDIIKCLLIFSLIISGNAYLALSLTLLKLLGYHLCPYS